MRTFVHAPVPLKMQYSEVELMKFCPLMVSRVPPDTGLLTGAWRVSTIVGRTYSGSSGRCVLARLSMTRSTTIV